MESAYKGYIYCVTNNVNNMQYIGQTIRTIKRRWSSHITESKTEENPSYFHKAIIKYGSDNFSVKEIHRVSGSTKEDIKQTLNGLEIKYINDYNTIRPNGYNLTIGGDTSSHTRQRSIVQISKHGEIINTYDSIASALRELDLAEGCLSAVLYGDCNMSNGYYWKYADDSDLISFINNIENPYVCMYDSDGNLQKIYDCFYDASKDTNLNVSRLKQCCYGERPHSKDRQFRAYENKEKILPIISELVVEWGKPVIQYDLNKNFIASYKNIKDVILKNNSYTLSPIRNCCSGHRNKAYDFIWQYA